MHFFTLKEFLAFYFALKNSNRKINHARGYNLHTMKYHLTKDTDARGPWRRPGGWKVSFYRWFVFYLRP